MAEFVRVARLGDMEPMGLLLASVGALIFGFGLCLVPLLLILGYFSNHLRLLWNGNWPILVYFCQRLVPWLQKNLATLEFVLHETVYQCLSWVFSLSVICCCCCCCMALSVFVSSIWSWSTFRFCIFFISWRCTSRTTPSLIDCTATQ